MFIFFGGAYHNYANVQLFAVVLFANILLFSINLMPLNRKL